MNDKTLRLIANKRPMTLDEFAQIDGIGDYKKDKYGTRFLNVIKESTK